MFGSTTDVSLELHVMIENPAELGSRTASSWFCSNSDPFFRLMPVVTAFPYLIATPVRASPLLLLGITVTSQEAVATTSSPLFIVTVTFAVPGFFAVSFRSWSVFVCLSESVATSVSAVSAGSISIFQSIRSYSVFSAYPSGSTSFSVCLLPFCISTTFGFSTGAVVSGFVVSSVSGGSAPSFATVT